MPFDIISAICALIGTVGLILLFFWALRKLNKGMLVSGGKRLKILDRAVLGGEKSIVVISVAGKCILVGVTANRIEKLEELDMSEEEYMQQLYPENGEKQGGFFESFADALKKNIQTLKNGGNSDNSKNAGSGTSSNDSLDICDTDEQDADIKQGDAPCDSENKGGEQN